MFNKKYLRGEPHLPFIDDPEKADALLKKYVSPTHEPLWFYRNRGTTSPKAEAHYHNFKTVDNIKVMEQLGMHIPQRAHFFKGFGLVRERPFIEETIRYAKELHKRNMLLSVYVGGTMFTDYFFKEVPEAYEWRRVDMDGLPVTYGGYQLQRWFPCLNNPGYRAYMKKVLDVAVQEIDADEIFFDNQILRYEPRTCRCRFCVQHVRDLVKSKYTLEECEHRYGLKEYPDIQPPIFSQANKPWRMDEIHIPQMQDWVDHRVMTVVEFYKDMAGHVKKQKPSCAVGMNIKGIHGHNRAFDHGISHGDFADILDFTCIDGYNPGRKKGSDTYWSEARLYKSGHSTHISVVDTSCGTDLETAEAVVLNYRKPFSGGWIGDDPLGISPLGRFFCKNKRMFHERVRCHDIAVLRSEPSTNYNCAKVHEQLMPFEQTLIVEKLPWVIIFDKNISEISKYRIIALPEIQALSDKWLDALDKFMRSGGGVLASGGAGDYDGWNRPRDPKHAFDRWLGHHPEGAYESATVGKGRFVYVPEWDVHARWKFDDWFEISGDNLKPIKDRALFRKAIADATVGDPLAHYVSGNDFVIVEGIAAKKGKSAGIDLHFINYDPENTSPVMRARVGLPKGKKSASVVIVGAENEKDTFPSQDAQAVVSGGCVEFYMPTPKVYGLAQVTFK